MASVNVRVQYSTNVAEMKAQILQADGAIHATESSVERLKQSLGGQGLMMAANKAAAAIQLMGGELGVVGGVAKLSSSEIERQTGLIDKAIDKYKLMGMTAPPAMQELSNALHQAGGATVSLGDVVEGLAGKFGFSTDALGGLLGSLGEMSAVAAGAILGIAGLAAGVLELAHAAAETGDHINDSALKMGVGAQQASALTAAVHIAGGEADQLANAVFMMSKRLEDSGDAGDKARAALRGIGIDADAFISLDADKQILAISDAFRATKPNAEQVNDIFGRMGRDMLPVLSKDISGLTEKVKALGLTMSEDEVRAAVAATEESRTLHDEWSKLWTDIGVFFIPALQYVTAKVEEVIDSFRAWGAAIRYVIDSWDLLSGKPISAPSVENPLKKGLDLSQKHIADDIASRAGTAPGIKQVFDIEAEARRTLDEQIKKDNEAKKEAKKITDEWTESEWELIRVTKEAFGPLLAGNDLKAQMRTIGNGMAIGPGQIRTPTIGGVFGNGAVQNPQGGSFAAAGPAKIGPKTFTTDTTSFTADLFSSVPGSILAAIQGGGSKLQAAGSAIGTTIFGKDSALTTTITGGIKSLFGPDSLLTNTLKGAIPIIGSLIGPAIVGIQKLFGKSEESSKVSPVRDEFFKMQGGLESLNPRVMAVTGSLTLVDNIFKAKTVDQYNSAVGALKKVLDDADRAAQAAAAAFDQVNGKLQHITQVTPAVREALRAALNAKNPNDYAAALASVNTQLDAAAQKHQHLKDLADKYKISLSGMGKEFAQGEIDAAAKVLIEDMADLTAGGANGKDVLEGMAGSYSDLVQKAKDSGAELPNSIKPTLQKLIDMGDLVDKDGNKLKGLDGLNFGDTLDQNLKDLQGTLKDLKQTIDDLAAAWRGMGSDAANASKATAPSAPAAPSPHNTSGYQGSPDAGGFDDPYGYQNQSHTGSMVEKGRLLHFPIAHTGLLPDERMVMVQTGEAIIRRGAVQALGRRGVAAMNSASDAPPAPATTGDGVRTQGDVHFHAGAFTIIAWDGQSVRDMLVKKGGMEAIIGAVANGKRGYDVKLARALKIKGAA